MGIQTFRQRFLDSRKGGKQFHKLRMKGNCQSWEKQRLWELHKYGFKYPCIQLRTETKCNSTHKTTALRPVQQAVTLYWALFPTPATSTAAEMNRRDRLRCGPQVNGQKTTCTAEARDSSQPLCGVQESQEKSSQTPGFPDIDEVRKFQFSSKAIYDLLCAKTSRHPHWELPHGVGTTDSGYEPKWLNKLFSEFWCLHDPEWPQDSHDDLLCHLGHTLMHKILMPNSQNL